MNQNFSTPIKILIVSNRSLLLKAIASLCAAEPGLQVVGEAPVGKEAVEASDRILPDVVIIDLTLSTDLAIETIRQISKNDPICKILILSSIYDEEKILQAVIAGAIGFISDDASETEILAAIRNVSQNRTWLSIDLTRALIQLVSPLFPGKITPTELSKKELKIARLVAKGLSDVEISQLTQLSMGTVRYYVRNIFNKLHVKNRTQLALYIVQDHCDP